MADLSPPATHDISLPVDNHLYMHEEILTKNALDLVQNLRQTTKLLRVEAIMLGVEVRPLYLHLNSPGGYMTEALMLYDVIRTLVTPVIGIVDGMAASGASLILMACSQRLAYPSSVLLVHQLSGVTWGTHQQFVDVMKFHRMQMTRMVEIYSDRTKIGRRVMRDMLKGDFYMSAEEAHRKGFLDGIVLQG